MKFLLPVGGVTDSRFGILTSPRHKGIPIGIINGMDWAADNDAFNGGFKENFFDWLPTMLPYRKTCLFITAPDVLSNSVATLSLFRNYVHRLEGWPVAFVAQDGQENLEYPDYFDALFIGGSTEWKTSPAAEECIERAEGKHIHIGRVNYGLRYRIFARMKGSSEFTCDGTRQRFTGIDKAMESWAGYMNQPSFWSDQ